MGLVSPAPPPRRRRPTAPPSAGSPPILDNWLPEKARIFSTALSHRVLLPACWLENLYGTGCRTRTRGRSAAWSLLCSRRGTWVAATLLFQSTFVDEIFFRRKFFRTVDLLSSPRCKVKNRRGRWRGFDRGRIVDVLIVVSTMHARASSSQAR